MPVKNIPSVALYFGLIICFFSLTLHAQSARNSTFGDYVIKSTEPSIQVKMHLDSVTKRWMISYEKNRFARKPVNSISIVGVGYFGEHEYAGYKPSTYVRIIIENEPLSGAIRAYFPNMFWRIQSYKEDIPVQVRIRLDSQFIFEYTATIIKKSGKVVIDQGQDLKMMIDKLEMAETFYLQMLDSENRLPSFEHTQWKFETNNAQKVIRDFQKVANIKWIPDNQSSEN